MPEPVFLDSEFNDDLVLCFVIIDQGERHDFDTRTDATALARYIERNRDRTFVAFSIAAEVTALLRLDIEPPTAWVDLMPEATQIVTTHPAMRSVRIATDDGLIETNPKTPNLLRAVELLCGDAASKAVKDETRELILSRSNWSADEFARILDYCYSDTEQLVRLWSAILAFHDRHKTPWRLRDALYRGKTTLNVATMLHRSGGFPVAEEWLRAIYDNRVRIIHAEVEKVARHYRGYQLFTKTEQGAKENLRECKRYADDNGIPWRLSEKSLSPLMREEYLSTFCKECPSLRPIKECRDLIVQLRRNRWTEGNAKDFQRPLIQNGHVKAVSVPFYTKSGRSQPLVNRGHILNARPFIRTAIRPPKGRVVLGCDWSQQEIAIALRFFPDARLRHAYETGDLYLALAKLAGAAPASATKRTHEFERSQFKSVQLGLAYGMGATSLGRKMFADLNATSSTLVITRDQAEAKAEEIFEWHKDTFSEYWEGVSEFIEDTVERGWCVSQDNWLYFADDDTPKTQLQNIRMQANGATMMHFALNALAKTGIDFLAEHHDAIYVSCVEDEAADVERTMRAIMNKAAEQTIGDEIRIKIDVKHYTHETGYYDVRANDMVALLNGHLEGRTK